MPYFHISKNPNIKRLMPRKIPRLNMRDEELAHEDRWKKVTCSAKSIAACIALSPQYDSKDIIYVYLCEDDGKWVPAQYDHPEASLEFRRYSPCNVVRVGIVSTSHKRFRSLAKAKEANRKARTIEMHESDILQDIELLIPRRRWNRE